MSEDLKTEKEVVKQEKMELTSEGTFALKSLEDQLKYAQYLMGQGLISETFKKPSQVVLAIQALKDLNLPNSCLKDFYVINSKPAVYGDTFIGLMMGSGLVEEFQVQFFDETGTVILFPNKETVYFGCAITCRRKGQSLNSTITYCMTDKELSRNNNPTWNKSPRDMLYRRCAGRCAKWIFADAIRGIELVDYLEDAELNKLTNQDKLDEVNKTFSN